MEGPAREGPFSTGCPSILFDTSTTYAWKKYTKGKNKNAVPFTDPGVPETLLSTLHN